MKVLVSLVTTCLVVFSPLSRAQDVVTCSGKIKSDFKIEYSKIDIHLYTKSGSLSETSDCAPNNGYFVVPVYDKGEYVIRVAPPTGWGFKPNEVAISFDGETDPCSLKQDIFFHFTGFTVSGQATNVDQIDGPRGVKIKIEGPGLFKEAETFDDGVFQIHDVLPGEYSVTGSHPVWQISEDPVAIVVSTDNVNLPVNSIQVEGYDVKGFIRSKDEPVANVLFLLYPQNGNEDRVKGKCDPFETPPTISSDTPPSCISVSSKEGTFMFPSLPTGKYRIVPHYQSAKSRYQVSPSEAEFTVSNHSVVIEPVFEAQGFSVFGKVLQKPEGEGLAGAKVTVDGQLEATTDASGYYQLLNVTAGTYTVEVSAPDVEFESLQVLLSPSSSMLSDVYPSRYSVCGKVKLSVHPIEAFKTGSRSVSVELESDPGRSVDSSVTNDAGVFCFMLAPGKYALKVAVGEDETRRGLVLLPQQLPVSVEHAPIRPNQLVFTQFTGTLSADITCSRFCPRKEEVSLERLSDHHKIVKTCARRGSSAEVQFESLLPGKYNVSILPEVRTSFCWSQSSLVVEVPSSGTHPPINFTLLGFKMDVQSTHNTDVQLFRDNDMSTSKIIKIAKGSNEICLNEPGDYSLVPESCYNFEGDMYIFMTTMPVGIELKAFTHKVSASVVAPEGSAVTIIVSFSNTKKPKKDKTLKPPQKSSGPDADGLYTYQYSFNGRPKTIATLKPYSKDLLCSPEIQSFTVGKECPESVPAFHCSKGLFVEGSVDPPLEGVAITVTLSNGQQIDVRTDESGRYTAGPLPKAVTHTVEPKMDHYVFHLASDDNPYNFRAIKMSQITVKVTDNSGSALSDTLVTISGEDFRSTDIVSEEGTITHQNMAPGEYYVKPILREFEFSPTSQVVEVKQGEDLTVGFTGRRVAFSVSGKVMSLNRAPLQGVTVQVTGQGEKCSSFKETSLSDETGLYKFRGIMPNCSYLMVVVTGDSSLVEKGIPHERHLMIMEDVSGVDFVAVLKPSSIFMTGNVITPTPEHLSTLKIVVYPDTFLDSSLYSTTPDSVGFFDIPLRLGAPTTLYVQAETSLSSHYYRIVSNTTSFSTTDFSDHITVFFSAEPLSTTADSSSRGSFIGILFAVGTVFFLFNTDKIYRLVPPVSAIGALKRLSIMKRNRRR